MTEADTKELDEYVFGINDRDKEEIEFALSEYKDTILKPWPVSSRPAFPVYVKIINKLRQMGFDCDELIESGLALDITKQTTK